MDWEREDRPRVNMLKLGRAAMVAEYRAEDTSQQIGVVRVRKSGSAADKMGKSRLLLWEEREGQT